MVTGISLAKAAIPSAGARNGSRESPPQTKKSRESEMIKVVCPLTSEAASVARSRATRDQAGGGAPI